MEAVALKYDNFKKFCLESLPDNDFVLMLQNTSMDLFLKTIKIKLAEFKSQEEIIQALSETAKINKNDFTQEQNLKFERYVSYFTQVADCI